MKKSTRKREDRRKNPDVGWVLGASLPADRRRGVDRRTPKSTPESKSR